MKSFFERRLKIEVEIALRPGDRRAHLRRSGAKYRLDLHPVFQEARPVHLHAVADMIQKRDPFSEQIVDAFFHQKSSRIRSEYGATRRVALYPYGRVYNLMSMYRRLNEEHFDGRVRAYVTWGKRSPRGRKRWSIRFGSYDAATRIIRVHPLLDSEAVPRYFVEYIVYHEMLHQAAPEEIRRGRRIVHTEEFLRREREFPHFKKAIEWERENTRSLLRRAVPT